MDNETPKATPIDFIKKDGDELSQDKLSFYLIRSTTKHCTVRMGSPGKEALTFAFQIDPERPEHFLGIGTQDPHVAAMISKQFAEIAQALLELKKNKPALSVVQPGHVL